LAGQLDYGEYVYQSFGGCLSGFARRTNRQQGLSGQVLIKPTLHGLTTKGEPGVEASRSLIAYVSYNYAKHHLAPATEKYPYSSLHNAQFNIIDQRRLIEVFGEDASYKSYMLAYLKRYAKAFYNFDEDEFFSALTPRYLDRSLNRWKAGEWRPKLNLY